MNVTMKRNFNTICCRSVNHLLFNRTLRPTVNLLLLSVCFQFSTEGRILNQLLQLQEMFYSTLVLIIKLNDKQATHSRTIAPAGLFKLSSCGGYCVPHKLRQKSAAQRWGSHFTVD